MKFLILFLLTASAARGQNFRDYAPLPPAPAGFSIREVARMPDRPVKITTDAAGAVLYVLCISGDVYRVDLPDGPPTRVLDHATFAPQGQWLFQGLCLDGDGRMYVVGNRTDMDAKPYAMNHVTIFRGRVEDAKTIKPWFEIDIPFAIDTFQHGVSEIKQGPGGWMYVSSGSRTDHGERGNDPKLSPNGETNESACIWKLDPKADKPALQIFARGLRNPFGFCSDDRGRMFATENGPNADPPEEVNLVEAGKHYGFPHRFADWTTKGYPDQPDAPPGLTIEPPLAKIDPHSSPAGIIWLDGKLYAVRFGNMIKLPHDVGFDMIGIDPETGAVTPFLKPLARPTDLHLSATGKIYICEHTRQLANTGEEHPGRILELSRR
jgi:glucose/arabinose dehydrogenase